MRLLRKLFMITLVASVTYYLFTNYGGAKYLAKSPQLKKSTDNILGAANHLFSRGASVSANLVTGLVLKTATDPLIKEYDKLKPPQKEIIKKQICK